MAASDRRTSAVVRGCSTASCASSSRRSGPSTGMRPVRLVSFGMIPSVGALHHMDATAAMGRMSELSAGAKVSAIHPAALFTTMPTGPSCSASNRAAGVAVITGEDGPPPAGVEARGRGATRPTRRTGRPAAWARSQHCPGVRGNPSRGDRGRGFPQLLEPTGPDLASSLGFDPGAHVGDRLLGMPPTCVRRMAFTRASPRSPDAAAQLEPRAAAGQAGRAEA